MKLREFDIRDVGIDHPSIINRERQFFTEGQPWLYHVIMNYLMVLVSRDIGFHC